MFSGRDGYVGDSLSQRFPRSSFPNFATVCFTNAGVQNVLAETADSPRDDYDKVIGITLRGVWSCIKFELQQMREQGGGAIVNCSSLGGLLGGARNSQTVTTSTTRI